MGYLTLTMSVAFVVLQATLLLLSSDNTQWAFSLARAVPDASAWASTLDRLIELADSNNSSSSAEGGINNLTLDIAAARQGGGNGNDTMTAMLCLHAAFSDRPSYNNNKGDAGAFLRDRAYDCLLRRHSPRVLQEQILDSFNPHLLLLSLCCIQALICSARIHVRKGADSAAEQRSIPLPCVAALLFCVFVACLAVQAAYSDELVRYPTLILVILEWGVALWYAIAFDARRLGEDDAWGFVFHQQMVVIPLATLAIAVFGSRQWPCLFADFIYLNVCVNLLWMALMVQPVDDGAAWTLRSLMIALLLLFLVSAHIQFGAFDNWRYAVTLLTCTGLMPLALGALHNAGIAIHRLHTISLMAANTGLLSLIVTLSQIDPGNPIFFGSENMGPAISPHRRL